MTEHEVLAQPALAARLATASLDLKEIGWCDLDQQQANTKAQSLSGGTAAAGVAALKDPCKHFAAASASSKPAAQNQVNLITDPLGLPRLLYRAQKANTDYRLCFDLPATAEGMSVCHGEQKPGGSQSEATAYSFPQSGSPQDPVCTAIQSVSPGFLCTGQIELAFTIRSTYGIIYYLGEIVRQELYPDEYSSEVATRYEASWTAPDDPSRQLPLFEVTTNREASSGFLSADYDGRTFGVPDRARGLPFEVLDLVTELIALNKSAKDLPATSVITAVGGVP